MYSYAGTWFMIDEV